MTPPEASRVLGIDFGDRRTGVAVSDPLGWTAQGLFAIAGNMEATAKRVAQIAEEYGARSVVVGKPLNMNGTAGPRAQRTEAFIEKLRAMPGGDAVNVVSWDERLTTVQAARAIREMGGHGARARPGKRSADRRGSGMRGTGGGSNGSGMRGTDGGNGAGRKGAGGGCGEGNGITGSGKNAAVNEMSGKGAVDVVAATILLQSYLDSLRQ